MDRCAFVMVGRAELPGKPEISGGLMSLRKTVGTVGTLAQGAVSTAVSVARHPISSASLAAGFAKGVAEAGIDLVRGGAPEASTAAPPAPEADEKTSTEESTFDTSETSDSPTDPRDDLPGPDLAHFDPPQPGDLPEPVVIEAEPVLDEAFHTEPKAASRDSAHGGSAWDREEAEGYVEEIPTDESETERLVTSADQHVD
jgi:hypothetical protein